MVIKEDIYMSCFNTMRTLHIYVPDNYETCKLKYPVLYMYDGHNLFHDQEATYGKSWGLEKYLKKTKMNIIIVGIECNHEGNQRLEEFSPYNFTDKYVGVIQGRGDLLMKWVVKELKPWIDQHFRTLKKRQDTAIAGSSMGGLMALYTILHHNDVFSKAACLSPFLYGLAPQLENDLNKKLSKDTNIYISWGSDEFRSKPQLAKATNEILTISNSLHKQQLNIYLNQVVKGKHNEACWEKEVPTFLSYLFLSNV